MPPLVAALLKFGFSAIAPIVASKGKELVEEKLGVDLDKMLGTEEGRIKLRQLEMEHEQWFAALAERSEIRELDYFKAEVEDRASAREANTKIAIDEHAPWYQKALMPFMTVLVTLGFFGCMAALFYVSLTGAKLDDNSRDILIYAFGAMTGGWMLVMNFIYGSSHGSRQNQEAVAAALKRGGPQ